MHPPLLQNIPFENYLSQIFLLSGLIGTYLHTQIKVFLYLEYKLQAAEFPPGFRTKTNSPKNFW